MSFQRGLVSQSCWICSALFGVPTLDIAVLLKVVDLRTRISRLVKALSIFADLLSRRWHSLASQVHPFQLPTLARASRSFAKFAKSGGN
jgi:hypothetical protein